MTGALRVCMCVSVYAFNQFSPKDMLTDFRGRGRDSERGEEKHPSIVSHTLLHDGTNL